MILKCLWLRSDSSNPICFGGSMKIMADGEKQNPILFGSRLKKKKKTMRKKIYCCAFHMFAFHSVACHDFTSETCDRNNSMGQNKHENRSKQETEQQKGGLLFSSVKSAPRRTVTRISVTIFMLNTERTVTRHRPYIQ